MSFTSGRRPNSTKTWNFLNTSDRQSAGRSGSGPDWRAADHDATRTLRFPWQPNDVEPHRPAPWLKTPAAPRSAVPLHLGRGLRGMGLRQRNLHVALHGHRPGLVHADKESALPQRREGRDAAMDDAARSPRPRITCWVPKYFHDGSGLGGSLRAGGVSWRNWHTTQQDPQSWTPGTQQFPNIQEEYERFGFFENSSRAAKRRRQRLRHVDAQDELCRQMPHTRRSRVIFNPDIPLNGSGAPGSRSAILFRTRRQSTTFGLQQSWCDQTLFFIVADSATASNWRAPKGHLTFMSRFRRPRCRCSSRLTGRSKSPGRASVRWAASTRTTPMELIRSYRAHYAAVSWPIRRRPRPGRAGSVELTSSTLVVMHADHGWHLGEYVSYRIHPLAACWPRQPSAAVCRTCGRSAPCGRRTRAL